MKYDNPIVYTLNFKKILDFYVFNCAVPNVTPREVSLEKYGWKDTRKLEKKLLNVAGINKNNWQILGKTDEVAAYFKGEKTQTFLCVLYKNKDTNVESLLYCIRNAFAHGSFKTDKINNKKVYYLENYKGENLRGRLILQEKTLLDWIKVISDGEEKSDN